MFLTDLRCWYQVDRERETPWLPHFGQKHINLCLGEEGGGKGIWKWERAVRQNEDQLSDTAEWKEKQLTR